MTYKELCYTLWTKCCAIVGYNSTCTCTVHTHVLVMSFSIKNLVDKVAMSPNLMPKLHVREMKAI